MTAISAVMLAGAPVTPLSVAWISYGAITAGQNPSWASQNIGAASSSRYVVVMVYSNSGGQRDVTSVTIGGVTATLLFTNNANYSTARTTTHFYGLLVTSGTTATIQVNWSASVDQTAISVYSVTGSVAPTVAQTAANNGVQAGSLSLTIPANGVGIGGRGTGNGGTFTWGNLTEDVDVNAGTYYSFSSASSATAGTLTRTCTSTAGTTDNAMSAIALQP